MQPGILTRARRHPAKLLLIVAAILLLIVFVGHWGRTRSAQDRALRNLPEPERRALYGRTIDTLRTVCARDEGRDGLSEFCAEQAKVVLGLPECDAGCRDLASRYFRGATR